MKRFAKYLTLFLIVANYTLCLINLISGEYTHAFNEFTIGTLFSYVYMFDNNLKD